MKQKNVFAEGELFHVCNKSIANYGIYKDFDNSRRFYQALHYFNNHNYDVNLSKFLKKNGDYNPQILDFDKDSYIKFISYCIMPDHYQLKITNSFYM